MWRLPWNLGASISWNPQGLSRPVIGLLYLHRIYKQVCDTCTFILTVPHIVSFWDPRMHYKCWYIGSVLQKAWWWLNTVETCCLNSLNPELNPICYLLALLWAHHFLHVSRIRVKLLTFRLLMSYTYGAPILDVSRSHTTTQHSR